MNNLESKNNEMKDNREHKAVAEIISQIEKKYDVDLKRTKESFRSIRSDMYNTWNSKRVLKDGKLHSFALVMTSVLRQAR